MKSSNGDSAMDAGESVNSFPASMAQKTCTHTRMVRGEITFDFNRPGQERASYAAPVSVLVCADCGSVSMQAEMHRFLCDWLEGR
jgi:hypothetical protein